MWEMVEGLHKALRIESTLAFVLLCGLFFGVLGAGIGWVIDKGYKNSNEYKADHPDPKSQAVASSAQSAPTAVSAPTTNTSTTRASPSKRSLNHQQNKGKAPANEKVSCDATAAVNICNSQDTQIGKIATSNPKMLKNDNTVGTKIDEITSVSPADQPKSHEATPQKSGEETNKPFVPPLQPESFVECKGGAAVTACNAQGTVISNYTNYGCDPVVKTDNTFGTTITGVHDHNMPADACVFYYGALRLEPPCYQRNNLLPRMSRDDLRSRLIKWERGVDSFWRGDNFAKWKARFGNEAAAENKSLDELCADIDDNSPKMAFFRLVYYGFEHLPD